MLRCTHARPYYVSCYINGLPFPSQLQASFLYALLLHTVVPAHVSWQGFECVL